MTRSETVDLGAFARRAYLSYGMATLLDRALPDVRDGLKPVQRRILYTMHKSHLGPEGRASKCARIVGDTMGKYHPHGDQSIYDALVRMAQSFTLRYPLIDGQGNFGRRDGDRQAAMRYTEARLASFAEVLLAEIDAGTVGFRSNYDDSLSEPECLPAQLPHVLLNPSSGIAVGMATEIPPHNLGEICDALCALIKQPNLSLAALMEHVPGPDFACGGRIVSTPEEIREIYRTGRGSLRLEARWHVEKLARGRWQIVVDELPQPASPRGVLEKIDRLVDPGKKPLTGEQRQLRQQLLDSLGRMRDESGRDGLRLVFEPKSSKQDPEALMALLMSVTDLACACPVNMVVLGLDGRPRQMGLLELLKSWLDFRIETVTRRSRTRLDQVEDRMHVLDGRLKAFAHIDEIIKVIREADEPKRELIGRFGFSERQAEDVLSIRLRQLAKLEWVAINRERQQRTEEADRLRTLLSDRKRLLSQIRKEIRQLARRFGDPRRSELAPKQETAVGVRKIVDADVTVIVSRKGWLRLRAGHGLDLAGLSWKAGDGPLAVLEAKRSGTLALFDQYGRCYNVALTGLSDRDNTGVPMASQIDPLPGARLVGAAVIHPGRRLLLASSSGYGFVVEADALQTRRRKGKEVLTVPEGGIALPPVVVPDDDDLWVVVETEDSRRLAFPLAEVKTLPRGKGVKLASSAIAALEIVANSDCLDPYRGRRGGRGKQIP